MCYYEINEIGDKLASYVRVMQLSVGAMSHRKKFQSPLLMNTFIPLSTSNYCIIQTLN